MRIRERRHGYDEMLYNMLFFSIVVAFTLFGYLTHVIYFVNLLLFGEILVFLTTDLMFKVMTGESLSGMILFHLKRDYRDLKGPN